MASNGTLEHAGKSENLTEAEVVARFDQLAKAGHLFYDYAFRTETAQSEKMLVEFRISKALASKPWQTTSTLDVATEPGTGPKPGSDINVNGLGVQSLNGTHELTLNMFSSYRPHLLMLTNDGYRRQWEPLDIDDFRAATQFLSNMDQDYLVFYNCKVEGAAVGYINTCRPYPTSPSMTTPGSTLTMTPSRSHTTRPSSQPLQTQKPISKPTKLVLKPWRDRWDLKRPWRMERPRTT
uniref:Ap4A phosphorylase 1/2 N-terminal domain-containing protein n=1 Tax=Bionectria ochroleuca TaxID=29856 RepID=A0A8H7K9X0_BIOOC